MGTFFRFEKLTASERDTRDTRHFQQAELFKVKEADCRSCNDKNNFYGKGFQTVADIPFG